MQNEPFDELGSVGLPPGPFSRIKLPNIRTIRTMLRWPLLLMLVAWGVLFLVIGYAMDSGGNQGVSPVFVIPAIASLGAAAPFFLETERWVLRVARGIIVVQGGLIYLTMMILASAAVSISSMGNSKDPDYGWSWIIGGGTGSLLALLGLFADRPPVSTTSVEAPPR